MTLIDREAREVRARNLEGLSLNGLKWLSTALPPGPSPANTQLELHFFNDIGLAKLVAAADPSLVFSLSGGSRIPAGGADGQVQVTAIDGVPNSSNPDHLLLTVEPVGDYSDYNLELDTLAFADFDPFFSELTFKFRPGCFGNCEPELASVEPRPTAPAIDYLVRDYESFRHMQIAAMSARVPGWQVSSEADQDMAVIDLISAVADELADYQDRVINEAWLMTARRRVSLARHARLMDYHIHQGNQADTILALQLRTGQTALPSRDFTAATVPGEREPVIFAFREQIETLFSVSGDLPAMASLLDSGTMPPALVAEFSLHGIAFSASLVITTKTVPGTRQWLITDGAVYHIREQGTNLLGVYEPWFSWLLNELKLHTWSGATPALAVGTTGAWLKLATNSGNKALTATAHAMLLRRGRILIQKWRVTHNRTDPRTAQLLTLLAAGPNPIRLDPVSNEYIFRLDWQATDALRESFGGTQAEISLFHGNLMRLQAGQPASVSFEDPNSSGSKPFYETTARWGTLCRLPPELPLAYLNTPPGGEIAPRSTLEVSEVSTGETWQEVTSLIHSTDRDKHFIVETDELGRNSIRFGNGRNGREWPAGETMRCNYQAGAGPDGNIGANKLLIWENLPEATSIWNPFQVSNGRGPESPEVFLRRIPEAFRGRQLRAVTLADYVARAEELPEVDKAAARYQWTGSWRAVRISIDAKGTTTWSEDLEDKLFDHLEAVRLIGDDLELRPARRVPLDIRVALCIRHDLWPEDVGPLLERAFSEDYDAEGHAAFFHPDRWTFGQELHRGQIAGRVQAVPGVDHIISIRMSRRDRPGASETIRVMAHEIIQVRSGLGDPDQGTISFDLRGGRQ